MKRRTLLLMGMMLLLVMIPSCVFARTDVTEITLDTIPEPEVGGKFAHAYYGFTVPEDAPFKSYMADWYVKSGDEWIDPEETEKGFLPDTLYRLEVNLYPKDGYNFLEKSQIDLSNFKAGDLVASDYEHFFGANGARLYFDFHTPKAETIIPVTDIVWKNYEYKAGGYVYFYHEKEILPADATYRTVIYQLEDIGNTGTERYFGYNTGLHMGQSNGPVKLTATIKNGIAEGKDFVKTFTLYCVGGSDPQPQKSLISELSIHIDVPNDGQQVPALNDPSTWCNAKAAACEIAGVYSTQFGKTLDGMAAAGETWNFVFDCKAAEGYEFADKVTATVNGKPATVARLSSGDVKAAADEGFTVTYNNTITIKKDLPEVIEYVPGGSIRASFLEEGTVYKYQWYLKEKTEASGGKKGPFREQSILLEDQYGTNLLILNADASYDGKSVYCVMNNSDGNQVTRTAVIKAVASVPTTPFTDVAEDSYYYDATVWAYNAKPQITDGTSATTFGPNKICTRGQVVTFLWRAAGCPEPKSSSNPFTDVKTSDYFYKPVLWAVEQGITDGTAPDQFSPAVTCKNSHILTFIWRALGEPGKTGNGTWYTDAYNWATLNQLLSGTFAGSFDINDQCPRKNVVTYLYRYYTMSNSK